MTGVSWLAGIRPDHDPRDRLPLQSRSGPLSPKETMLFHEAARLASFLASSGWLAYIRRAQRNLGFSPPV